MPRAEPVVEPIEEAAPASDPLARLREEFRDMPEEAPQPFRVEPQPPQHDEAQPSERIYFDEDPPVVEAAATAAVVEETRIRSRRRTEPEDLAALTVEAAAMAGVPLAGTNWIPGR